MSLTLCRLSLSALTTSKGVTGTRMWFNRGLVNGSMGGYPVFFAPVLQILQEYYRNKLIRSIIKKATTPIIVTIAVQD